MRRSAKELVLSNPERSSDCGGRRTSGCRPAAQSANRLRTSTYPAAGLVAEHPDHVWALDFQFDQTSDARILKLLNIVDEHSREALKVGVDRRIDSDPDRQDTRPHRCDQRDRTSFHPLRQRARAHCQRPAGLVPLRTARPITAHRAVASRTSPRRRSPTSSPARCSSSRYPREAAPFEPWLARRSRTLHGGRRRTKWTDSHNGWTSGVRSKAP
jgi:hypothetical protein